MDADLLPLSALQHLIFCERQCALIHVEQIWADNPLTIDGSHKHRAVDKTAPRREQRGEVTTLRGVWLRSRKLGVTGRADVVEMRQSREQQKVYRPVEYKRGRPKAGRADEVQLCAQAICLEEMTGSCVVEGDLYYGQTARRVAVAIDTELRELTATAARRLHDIVRNGERTVANVGRWCKNCSLMNACMPGMTSGGQSALDYLAHETAAVHEISIRGKGT